MPEATGLLVVGLSVILTSNRRHLSRQADVHGPCTPRQT